MAGIYIHIPFCKKACTYCNFHFSVNQKLMPEIVSSIVKEAMLRQDYLCQKIETVYFGGGTPSLLSGDQLSYILNELHKLFFVDVSAEITLEANPDDISIEKLTEWKEAGINRLSIGIQSFFEEDLQWMNRAHNADQALASISNAQKAGFENISIDLIYGGPTLTNEHWQQNLKIANDFGVPHLSCYALTVEPKTVLSKKIINKELSDIDHEKQANHFNKLQEFASLAGYSHYEISNLALIGKKSKHNANYWSGEHYLGLGPAAHSFNGNSRQWNVSNNNLYITSIQQDIIPFEIELLTITQKLNEYIMISLRTSDGINLNNIKLIAGESISSKVLHESEKYIINKKMELKSGHLILTNQGKFYADGIAADLFQL